MVKKLQKMAAKKEAAAASGLFDSQLAGAVKDSAQQIWLAGMGAFAKAQAEGGKVFEALVKEGARLQRKTQSVAEERLGEVTGRMSAMASDVSNKAGASWDKLETIFEERTAKALAKLGVPTAKDVAELARRVDELTAAVGQASKAARGGSRAAATEGSAPRARKTSSAQGAGKPAAKTAAKAVKAAGKAPAKATTPRKTAARKTAARKSGASKTTAPAADTPSAT
jgi:poly(hydroxyalkanoate) granule-associated protein